MRKIISSNCINLMIYLFCSYILLYNIPCSEAFNKSTSQSLEQNFHTENLPEWWSNNLGMESYVVPGFSPLKVIDHSVELFQKKYLWKESFLPDKIVSRQITITEKMQLIATVAGERVQLIPELIQINENKGVSANVMALGTVTKNLKIQVDTHIEYDGVAQCTIYLTPNKPVKIDKLEYIAHIKDSPTMEVLGFTAKNIRKQKDRHDILKLPYAGRFLNVLGFSDGDRSFWWFADNAKGWIWNGKTVTEVSRNKKKIVLKQTLIGNSYIIDKPIKMTLNFLATPVKEIGSSWRSKRIMLGHPDEKEAVLGGMFKLWWTNAFAHDAFPYTSYPADTREQTCQADRSAFPGRIKNTAIINEAKKNGIQWIPYFSLHALSNLDPALSHYKKYWIILPPRTFKEVVKPYSKIYGKSLLSHRSQSYSNYLLWRLNEEIDNLGMEGIYFDHGPPQDSNNLYNGGWIDSNGNLQPSLDILGIREFLKRLRVLFAQKNKAGYIFIHNSNREIIPAFTFAYATIGGEQYRGGRVKDGDYLDYISIDEFRTRFSTTQSGVISILLPVFWTEHKGQSSWHGSEQQKKAYRRVQALTLLHDVLDWPIGAHVKERNLLIEILDSFGIDKAKFIGYWNPDLAATATNDHFKISCYARTDNSSYLFIVANTAEISLSANINFDYSLLGIKINRLKISFDKIEENFQSASIPISLTIPAKDFRLILLQQK